MYYTDLFAFGKYFYIVERGHFEYICSFLGSSFFFVNKCKMFVGWIRVSGGDWCFDDDAMDI